MEDIDNEEIHLSRKERWIALLAGIGILAVSVCSIWWFCDHIPVRFLQALWIVPNGMAACAGLSFILYAIVPNKAYWVFGITAWMFS